MIRILPRMKLRVEDKLTFPVQSFETLSSTMLRYDGEVTNAAYWDRLRLNEGKAVWLTAEPDAVGSYRSPEDLTVSVHYGDEVYVDYGRSEERGIWVLQKPGDGDGDNCRLVRKAS